MYVHFIDMTFSDHGSGHTFGSRKNQEKRKRLNVTKENKNGIKGKQK